jgi:RNA polymerase sigma-70 factor (ECF subfamily)
MDEDAPTQSDLELALNIACGDDEAIRAFIAQHGPKIIGFLQSRYRPIWEDAWQEALIRLVDRIDRFDPEKGSLSTWSMKLAQNCARSILRAEQKHPCAEAHEDIERDQRRPPEEQQSPKQRKQAERSAEQIREAIAALPPKERRVILADLAHPDGKAAASDLADAWDTNENAIHQARSRAKKKLREELERRGIYRKDTRP